jgi:hypothetical protein
MTLYRIDGEITREVVGFVEANDADEAFAKFQRLDCQQVEPAGRIVFVMACKITTVEDAKS